MVRTSAESAQATSSTRLGDLYLRHAPAGIRVAGRFAHRSVAVVLALLLAGCRKCPMPDDFRNRELSGRVRHGVARASRTRVSLDGGGRCGGAGLDVQILAALLVGQRPCDLVSRDLEQVV